jgi:hypothetical protein
VARLSGGRHRARSGLPGSLEAGLAAASAEDLASTSLGDRCWPLTGLPFSHVAAWVNVELMKNTAEIGATRRLLNAR